MRPATAWHNRARRALVGPAVLVAGAALATSACSAPGEGTVRAEAPVTTPLSIPPLPIATTSAATTTTTAPTTTAAPAPTTTAPPSTTTTVLEPPSNVEVVGAFDQPIPAVGTSSGEATKVVQLRLLQLGFWNAGPDGEYGLTTRQAVMAFQKYLGLEATGKVDESTAAYLQFVEERAHGQSNTGTLIEVDKTRQLLFVIRDGKTLWTFNTSTGDGLPYEEPDKNSPGEVQRGVSITPNGLWRVDRERAEGWWEGDLGEIYRPKYFRYGVAVHGSNSIPNYPASHGCVRVSVPAMDFIWAEDLMPMGTTVWVHGG